MSFVLFCLVQATKCEDASKHGHSLSELKRCHAGEVAQMTRDFEEKLQAINRRCEEEKKQMKESFAAEQEGWREMIIKKLKREFAEKEASLRGKLKDERDAELEVLVTKLEEESELQREQVVEEERLRSEEASARHKKEVKALEADAGKHLERYRESVRARQDVERQLKAMESLHAASQEEVVVKGESVRFLEKQLGAARSEFGEREREMRDAFKAKLADMEAQAAQCSEARKGAEERAEKMERELKDGEDRNRRQVEEIECRVKEAIGKRERIIANLQRELVAMQENLDQ